MELLGAHSLIVCQLLLLYLVSTTDTRPVPLSSSGETRRYSMDELEELMKELQQQGALPTAAGKPALNPEIRVEPSKGNSRDNGGRRTRRIKKKLMKLERIFKKAYKNPRSGSSMCFNFLMLILIVFEIQVQIKLSELACYPLCLVSGQSCIAIKRVFAFVNILFQF